MKIGIMAANSRLGTATVKAGIKALGRSSIIGLARTPEKAAYLGIEIRPGDYGDSATLLRSLQGVDALLVISLNGDPAKRPPLHRKVFAAARDAGVQKVVYTSVQGTEQVSDFAGVVISNRETEEDLKNSGLAWSISRNGIYLEPDMEYIPKYVSKGCIWNCAGEGKCAYTTRDELAYAYIKMLTEDRHNGKTYNLNGEPISQQVLTELFNAAFDLQLYYHALTVEEYRQDRTEELGPFMANIITGIYESIRNGDFDNSSDYQLAAGRPHKSYKDLLLTFPQS